MFHNAGQHGPLVLMYHSVTSGAATPPWKWAISQQRFCEQLGLLKAAGWSAIRFSELLHPDSLPAKAVAITFDDGYADNYAAFEALAARDMCATWFIVSRDVGGRSSWTDPGAPTLPMLTGAQLREMQAAGMEIGSHTRSHARLTQVDAASLTDEVAGSRRELSELLDRDVDSFAYPYGLFDDAAVAAVREAGYKIACTTRSGPALRNTDVLRVKRLSVYAADDPASFARKLAFIDNDVSWGKLLKYTAGRVLSRLQGRAA